MKNIIAKRSGVAVAIAAAVASVFALSGCGSGSTFMGGIVFGKYDNASRYSAGSFTYSSNEVDSVDLDWVSGDVTFVVSDGETLSVTETSDGLDDDKKVHWYIDGSTLNIKFWKSGKRGLVDPENKRLTVEIPERLLELNVENTSGAVSAERIDAREITIDATSGNIELGAATATALIELESTSGSVRAESLMATRVKADSTSGDVELGDVKATDRADIESTSGQIKVRSLTARDARVDTTSGDITVSAADIENEYYVDTTSGEVNVGGIKARELEVESTSGDVYIVAEKLDKAIIDTTSGDVSISASFGMTVDFDTMSGNIVSDELHRAANGRYVFGDGACDVSVDTTSGDLIIR